MFDEISVKIFNIILTLEVESSFHILEDKLFYNLQNLYPNLWVNLLFYHDLITQRNRISY